MSSTLMSLAVLPGLLIIIYVFRQDRVEREPLSLIMKLVALGACSSVPAVILEGVMESFISFIPGDTLMYYVSDAFLVAALCEETCKFAFLYFGSWRNRAFDFRYDAVVYGVSTAVGFAVFENILYVLDGGLSVAVLRAFTAVPLHAFCGIFMGVFYGEAKRNSVRLERKPVAPRMLLAVLVPICIHGIYDTLAFAGAVVRLLAFVVIMYVIAVRCIKSCSRDDWKSGFYPDGRPLGRY